MEDTYTLLDSGDGKKMERFGPYTIVRPASQAIWKPSLPKKNWEKADAIFTREGKLNWLKKTSNRWTVNIQGIEFLLSPTEFGHLGVFPEQEEMWKWIAEKIRSHRKKPLKILNLFAYSGGATLIAAREGAEVCHLDASKGMVSWARENAEVNNLSEKPIRWIIDDVKKFIQREIRRKNVYDAIILDPPTFGKGSKGEVFKFERDLYPLLLDCRKLLSDNPLFVLLSCHTPNITPMALHHILLKVMPKGHIEQGEMLLRGPLPLPNGTYARWIHE